METTAAVPALKQQSGSSLARDTQKLKDAVEQLESSRLELLQRIETLQANQQRAEQLRQADIQRFSQQSRLWTENCAS